jgi:hypothetical protein
MDELLDPLVLIYSSRRSRRRRTYYRPDATFGPDAGPAAWTGRHPGLVDPSSMGWDGPMEKNFLSPKRPVVKRERLSKGREGQN